MILKRYNLEFKQNIPFNFDPIFIIKPLIDNHYFQTIFFTYSFITTRLRNNISTHKFKIFLFF